MLHVDWKTESYGARNGHPGEYDTVLYFTVWLGVPVYFSFRRCVHVIELAKVGPGERLECLRGFAKTYRFTGVVASLRPPFGAHPHSGQPVLVGW
jgi:hypothetical protein